jgi:hypothetical protein
VNRTKERIEKRRSCREDYRRQTTHFDNISKPEARLRSHQRYQSFKSSHRNCTMLSTVLRFPSNILTVNTRSVPYDSPVLNTHFNLDVTAKHAMFPSTVKHSDILDRVSRKHQHSHTRVKGHRPTNKTYSSLTYGTSTQVAISGSECQAFVDHEYAVDNLGIQAYPTIRAGGSLNEYQA